MKIQHVKEYSVNKPEEKFPPTDPQNELLYPVRVHSEGPNKSFCTIIM